MEKLLNKTPAQNVRVYYKIQKNEKNIKFFAIIKKSIKAKRVRRIGINLPPGLLVNKFFKINEPIVRLICRLQGVARRVVFC